LQTGKTYTKVGRLIKQTVTFLLMSQVCDSCGKKPSVGCKVSHSHIRTLRRFVPNLAKKKVFDEDKKMIVKKKLCTRCLRTMVKIRKVRERKKTQPVRTAAAVA